MGTGADLTRLGRNSQNIKNRGNTQSNKYRILYGALLGLMASLSPLSAQPFQSCDGLSTTLVSDGSPSVGTNTLNVTTGDVISGTISGLTKNYDLSTVALLRFIGSSVSDPHINVYQSNLTYSFTVNAYAENTLGQAQARLFMYADAGITATVNCVGAGSSGGGGSGGGSGSSGSSNTNGDTFSIKRSIGQGRDYLITWTGQSGTENWTPIYDGPDSWWNGNTGRFNNRNNPRLQLQNALARLREDKSETQKQLEELEAELEEDVKNFKEEDLLIWGINGLYDDFDISSNDLIRLQIWYGSDVLIWHPQKLQQLLQLLNKLADMKRQEDNILAEQYALFRSTGSNANNGHTNSIFYADPALNQPASHAQSPFTSFNFSDNSANFGMTLRQLRAWRKSKAAQQSQQIGSRVAMAFDATSQPAIPQTDIEEPLPGLLGDKKFNAWIDAAVSWSRDNRSGNEGTGTSIQVRAGASYQLLEKIGIGSMLRYSHKASDRSDGSASTKGDGFGGSIFAQIQLPYGAIFTPVFAYERVNSDLDISNGATLVTGGFESDIYTYGGSLKKRFIFESDNIDRRYFIDPNLTLSYIKGKRHGYVRSDGSYVPSDSFNQGVLSFGPTFGLQMRNVSETIAMLEPKVGINGIWNFETPAAYTTTTGSVIKPTQWSASLNAGLTLQLKNGLTSTITGAYSGLGSDVNTGTFSGRLSLPF
ncbi:autotransporter outer membrane beta-barrel domain-containing protein [Cohaesibacter gelatinilyticus]|uniref:Autotransporter domain-containing protein n=1 Tax=Cohaesibacter gelatinilyticus TaxID=372072 RepID=A0A285PCD8_9HYPH|nr:autotransporter outer membrane beta-barrel domain-containing protein [Cohaesibacter gelatinilyticus]SNZ19389.1 hypothetical protein SAMN06265368_2474 [Cohaesibacter gelatinilyticus]